MCLPNLDSRRGELDEVQMLVAGSSESASDLFLLPEASFQGLADEQGGVRAFSAAQPLYNIIWRGSPNFWQGRVAATAIANHIMQSSIESADGWFKNENSEASAHFGVARDGRIYQWVRTENTAWANGPYNQPDQSLGWLMDAIAKKINPNKLTIAIEHEGYTGKPFTEEQFQATLWLHKQLIAQYHIPVDRQHIIGHYQIDKVNRPNCPGTGFPWDRLMSELKAFFSPVYDPNPAGYSVGDGVLALLTKMHESGQYPNIHPLTNEDYFKAEQTGNGAKISRTFTSYQGIIIYSEFDPGTGIWHTNAKLDVFGLD